MDSGFTGVWRARALLALGGWDEELAQDQDTELAARLRAAGGRVVCMPEMAASYLPRNACARSPASTSRYGRYRARTSVKHPRSVRPAHVLPPGLAATAAIAPLSRLARGGLLVYAAAVAVEAARLRAPRVAAPSS